MSRIKRTLTSLFFKVDQVVGEIENHDALIQAAIREQQGKLAAARFECNRIAKRSKQLDDEIQALEKKKAQWEQRAINESLEASSDNSTLNKRERALACIQQAEGLSEQISRRKEMASQYRAAAEKMMTEIKNGAEDLEELKQKHQFMKARQVTADALGRFGDIGSSRLESMETSFDRWEVKIGQTEFFPEIDLVAYDTQDLEKVYATKENEARLEERLSEILSLQQAAQQPVDGEGS